MTRRTVQASRKPERQASRHRDVPPAAGRQVNSRAAWAVFLLLVMVVMASALGVIYSAHKSRRLLNELRQVENRRNELKVEWGRLLLEQSSLVSQGRIEETAVTALDMEVPGMQDVVVIRSE